MKANFTKLYVLAVLLVSFTSSAFAQDAKFGKVSEAELKMSVYDKDTSAAAVILSDYGFTRFDYIGELKVVFERHIRIKIFKKSAYDWADVVVPFYMDGSSKEKVTAIRGFTFNLEGGKIVKDKLEGKSIFEEKNSENSYAKKFTMPNVKEGSVLDITYTVNSDFVYNLRDWEFQTSIPTIWSEYRAQIPEYFDYKFQMQGYQGLYKSENKRETVAGTATVSTPDMQNNAYVWVMKDVPALKEEKYITTVRDYQSKIEFELQRVHFPGQPSRVMTGDWNNVTKDLLESSYFGVQLNRSGFFKEELAVVQAKHKDPQAQMAAIFDVVKKRMTWNGESRLYTNTTIRKAWDERKGNSADINLLLTSMLLEAGLDAAPVILSTRNHGRINTSMSAMKSKFNYVVAMVRIGEKEYLLDATDPLVTPGMLPARCLNGSGRLIKKADQRWVSLQPSDKAINLFNAELTINEKGEIVGTGHESSGGYSALNLRRTILEEGEEKYKERLTKEVGDFKMSKATISNLDQLNGALDINYDINISGSGRSSNIIYLNPMLGRGEDENPFKLKERLYPVDFAMPLDQTYICRITIPEGYQVDETPKSVAVNLPESAGRFVYMVQQQGNSIQVMSKISINKPVFYAPEYAYLKEFFDQIIAKQAEQIVLKKVAAN
ncbi:DUF3857 domain-containing protein [Pontibacter akesuensis]|uniref:DUF3857 domain-containing protein n=1 Tax=Pontibacter akesuensis TaxID=388950 RepID=A0A1I7K3G7_9BACT|nr:DUF3857 domain-containing protein [Pontibacter akesuensis]GHA75353.1 hypothetical protein GCM10007389_31520 [Pontibacter akesuensis]SFU91984.1 protein of unknown function [Pontibacter akesuensis]